MPQDGTLEMQAAWWLLEAGQGFLDVFGKPFVDLDVETGLRITQLAQRLVPKRTTLLQEIRELLASRR